MQNENEFDFEHADNIKRHKVKILYPIDFIKNETNTPVNDYDSGDAVGAEPEAHGFFRAAAAKRRQNALFEKADAFFRTRRRLYLLFISVMTVFTVAGLCLFLRRGEIGSLDNNVMHKFGREVSFYNAFLLCSSELLFSLILFAFGMTAFAPLLCLGYLSYYFVRYGYYSDAYFRYCLNRQNPYISLTVFIVFTAFAVFAMIVYCGEVWRYSSLASSGISNALKSENFIPYLINFLLYFIILILSSFLMLLFIGS